MAPADARRSSTVSTVFDRLQQQALLLTMSKILQLAPVARAEPTAPPDFIKAEKNLLSLGLFTPSSKELSKAKSKTISFIRVDGDRRTEASVTIAASAIYGLPDTADQDKYLAMQKLITERRRLEGRIENPFSFTTAELLKVLGRAKGGKRYGDVAEFLQRMTLTGIVSRRAVFLADRKAWATETFHVFEKVISVGESLPDGAVAQKNYVWLSEWQLNNINHNFTLPIDIESYRRLRNHIAKGMVPHLQIWLYTSRSDGCFAKRYDQLCQLLGLQPQKHASRIRQQLGPSLDELREHGYIGSWALSETRDGKGFKSTTAPSSIGTCACARARSWTTRSSPSPPIPTRTPPTCSRS
jgi:hypothetical protein